MHINKIKNESGFTLIEIAVVLVIFGVLLGSVIGTFAERIETTRRDNTKSQLEDIKSAILGFASANGRLPCPATTTSTGKEQPEGGSSAATPCTLQHGFVPGKTLGINAAYNRDHLVIDAWGNPIRYSVAIINANAFTNPPGVGGISDVGIDALIPNLNICTALSTAAVGCGALASQTLVGSAPFVILSLGKDGGDFVESITPSAEPPTTDQAENAGEAKVAKNATGENLEYTVGNGTDFVSKSYSSADSTAGQFDDLIIWVSPYVLYSRMIEAGQIN